MTYNIFSPTAPKMPQTGKGTKFIKFILSQASSDMREPLVPMAIPALAAHLCGVTFVYSDNKRSPCCAPKSRSTSQKAAPTAGPCSPPDTKPWPYHRPRS